MAKLLSEIAFELFDNLDLGGITEIENSLGTKLDLLNGRANELYELAVIKDMKSLDSLSDILKFVNYFVGNKEFYNLIPLIYNNDKLPSEKFWNHTPSVFWNEFNKLTKPFLFKKGYTIAQYSELLESYYENYGSEKEFKLDLYGFTRFLNNYLELSDKKIETSILVSKVKDSMFNNNFSELYEEITREYNLKHEKTTDPKADFRRKAVSLGIKGEYADKLYNVSTSSTFSKNALKEFLNSYSKLMNFMDFKYTEEIHEQAMGLVTSINNFETVNELIKVLKKEHIRLMYDELIIERLFKTSKNDYSPEKNNFVESIKSYSALYKENPRLATAVYKEYEKGIDKDSINYLIIIGSKNACLEGFIDYIEERHSISNVFASKKMLKKVADLANIGYSLSKGDYSKMFSHSHIYSNLNLDALAKQLGKKG